MEKSNITKSNYKPYISGLKGFACLMVMVGHYIGLYKYAETFPVQSDLLNYFGEFLDSKLGFILNESYWVVLFFVVSGYLVANSKISDLKSVVEKSVMRFLRLGFPVLVAFVIVFVIYKVIGFHTADTIGIFENSLVQGSLGRTYSLYDVIFSPIRVLLMGEHLLNDPYWCLREMFITSILIYFLLWIKEKLKNETIFLIAFFVVFTIGLVEFNVIYAGLFGMMVALLEKEENRSFLKNKVFVFLLVIFCALMYIMPRIRLACVFFGALIILIPRLPIMNKILSSKVAQFVAKISFGIYSFHWPVLCSIGMLILMNIHESIGLGKACIVTAIACAFISVVISVFYYYCIEKYIYIILKKIEKGLKKKNG